MFLIYFIFYEVKSLTGKNKHINKFKKDYFKGISLNMYLVTPKELKDYDFFISEDDDFFISEDAGPKVDALPWV